MAKFKVGDEVVVIPSRVGRTAGQPALFQPGDKGVVTEVETEPDDGDFTSYFVDFDRATSPDNPDRFGWYVYECELKSAGDNLFSEVGNG